MLALEQYSNTISIPPLWVQAAAGGAFNSPNPKSFCDILSLLNTAPLSLLNSLNTAPLSRPKLKSLLYTNHVAKCN